MTVLRGFFLVVLLSGSAGAGAVDRSLTDFTFDQLDGRPATAEDALELWGFARFSVETDSGIGDPDGPSVQSAR